MKNVHNIDGYLYITSNERIEDNNWYLGLMFTQSGTELLPSKFNVGYKPCGEIPMGGKIV